MPAARGTTLLLLLLLGWFAFQTGREALLHEEGPPAFFVDKPDGIRVLLGSGFPRRGVQQFSDGSTLEGVIKMTGLALSPELAGGADSMTPMLDGEAVEVVRRGSQVVEMNRKWMPALQRIALDIPLHPDRMTLEDWESLSGIGPKLARAIEDDRQQNGDFGSFDALERVRGVGPKRIAEWRKFF